MTGRLAAALLAVAAASLPFVTGAAPAPSADATAGRGKAAACAACHGQNGIAIAPDAPNLAGQPEAYLVEQLRAYRGGTRKHEVMSLMAKPLSDGDIAQLSAWFASQRTEVKAD